MAPLSVIILIYCYNKTCSSLGIHSDSKVLNSSAAVSTTLTELNSEALEQVTNFNYIGRIWTCTTSPELRYGFGSTRLEQNSLS